MNKYYLLVSLFLSSSVMVSADPKQKKAETWIDASVKAKTKIKRQLRLFAQIPVSLQSKDNPSLRNADRFYLDEA